MIYQKRVSHVRQCWRWDSSKNMEVTEDKYDLITEDKYAYRIAPDMVVAVRLMVGNVCRIHIVGTIVPMVTAIFACGLNEEGE